MKKFLTLSAYLTFLLAQPVWIWLLFDPETFWQRCVAGIIGAGAMGLILGATLLVIGAVATVNEEEKKKAKARKGPA